MKKKSAITAISVFLNLVLFAALAYFNKINSQPAQSTAPLIFVQHLDSKIGLVPSVSHEIALASVK